MLSTWGSKGGGGSAPVTGTPIFDTNAGSKQHVLFSGAATANLPAMTTDLSHNVIIVMVGYEYNTLTPTVSSVTAAGLVFTKRGSVLNPTAGAHGCSIEFWSAPAASTLSAKVITVNMSSNIDDACAGAWAINAAYTTVWDPNGGLPATIFNTTSTNPPVSTFSTTKSDDMLFYSIFDSQGGVADTTDPAGWTLIFARGTFFNGGGTNFSSGAVWFKSVSAPQSSATVQCTTVGNQVSWTAYVDAVTGDS